MKREANFQITFNHWLKNVWKKTGAFELKQTKTDSIPFTDVKEHQAQALDQVRYGSTFVYKIPDVGYQNPFDCFSMAGEEAYVVIKYPDFFCLIDIDKWNIEYVTSKRRSLTSARARQLSTHIVDL